MNGSANHFSFVRKTNSNRVPGPYVPLQDEADSIRAVKNTDTVLILQIQSMKEYILRHYKGLIFRTLNRSIWAGDIELPDDLDYGQLVLSSANCTIGEMSLWRCDQYTVLADIIVNPEIFIGEGFASCSLYVELWIDMKTGMDFHAGRCGFQSVLPERPYWKLSSYLIHILRKDEIERNADELLLKYCVRLPSRR